MKVSKGRPISFLIGIKGNQSFSNQRRKKKKRKREKRANNSYLYYCLTLNLLPLN